MNKNGKQLVKTGIFLAGIGILCAGSRVSAAENPTYTITTWILGTHDENPQNQSFETIDFTAFFAFLLEKCLVMCYN